MDEIIALTAATDPVVRLKATREMCPCHVKADREEFWQRILSLSTDKDETIRYQVLHNLCDGSPPHLEKKVVDALEVFNRDPNKKIRRAAHKVLGSYLHTGEWNVM
uniref:HEAT repeat domain-containing protein n=1 Tax=Euplotes crassus TaxID=5936 RepID=A0A7S3KH69_EUPCR|mmetsp:Transcript_25474/g.25254  ORF Transcript_25474/g.25254 Transcript_25474/m.25254 type:complete len:106 (+) Transcript_25474:201-518(+)